MTKNPWEMGLSEAAAGDDGPWNLGLKAEQPKPRGALSEIANQARAGAVVELPQMVGQAMQYTSSPGNWMYEKGKSLADAATERGKLPENAPVDESQHGGVVNALAAGARMIPQSLAPAAAVGAGVAALPVELPAAAVLGGTALLGSLPAAFSQGQQTLDKAKEAGVSDEEARKAARINALIEGAGETAGTFVAGKALGIAGKAFSGAKTAGDVVKNATSPAILKPWAKSVGEAAVVEPLTEMGQNAGETAVENAYGIEKQQTPWQSAKDALAPTLGMTALLAPFGLVGHSVNARNQRAQTTKLESAETAPEERAQIAQTLQQQLNKVDPEAASAFQTNVAQAIQGGQPIKVDDSLFSVKPATAAQPPAQPGESTALQQQILDEQEQMAAGIDPADGPLSAAASMAVTSGAAKTPTQIALEQQQAELAAQSDAAESEIASATGIEDQADNLDWNRFVAQEQSDLADKRDKAAFDASRKRAETAAEMRNSTQQMLAEGAYEADRRREGQQARAESEPGLPFERIAPEDYDTLNPIKAGQGELVEDPVRRLPAPERQPALPQGGPRAPALGFTPQAPEPMRATADGQVGTAQQMEGSRQQRQQAAVEKVRTFMQGGATLDGRNLVDTSGAVVLPNLNIQQYREARQILSGAQSQAPSIAQPAPSTEQVAPNIPQEVQHGATGPDSAGVATGNPSQGSVDAGSVVDHRPGSRGRAGGPEASNDAAGAVAGVPGAGVGGAGRVKRRGGVVVTDERLPHHAESLAAMAQDAGWQEQGGRMIRDGNGNVTGRTKWLPRAEWFRAGMQADPQALAESVRKAQAGEAIPSKDQRTISAMMDYLDAQEQGRPLDEDSSAAEWERIRYNEASAREQAAFDAIDELLDATPLKDADAMRALGFTEDEIRAENEAANRQGSAGETQAGRAQERAADDRAGARDQGSANLLQTYSEQDLANRAEAERQAAERRAQDDKRVEDKARADSERDSFTLTGSDRQADVLAAQGQEGLFDRPASPSAPDESKAIADRIKARILDRLGSKPDSEYRGYADSEVSSWEPSQFTMKRGEWEALRKHAAAASGTKNGTKLTLTVEDVEDKIHDILTVQSVHQTVASMQVTVSRMRTVFDAPANQEPAKSVEPTTAASPLEPLFSDLDSPSTRKANKAKKVAAKLPQADRIEHVQAHFHDLLTQAMDAGNLEVNGARSLTEDNKTCL